MNLSTVKWAQWDKTQSRELLGLFICVCIALCTIVAHNIAQNIPDNFPPYPPDNHHCSDDVYLREGGASRWSGIIYWIPVGSLVGVQRPFLAQIRLYQRRKVRNGELRLKLNQQEQNKHATKNTANINTNKLNPGYCRLLRPPAWKQRVHILEGKR